MGEKDERRNGFIYSGRSSEMSCAIIRMANQRQIKRTRRKKFPQRQQRQNEIHSVFFFVSGRFLTERRRRRRRRRKESIDWTHLKEKKGCEGRRREMISIEERFRKRFVSVLLLGRFYSKRNSSTSEEEEAAAAEEEGENEIFLSFPFCQRKRRSLRRKRRRNNLPSR